ncbi:MAG TPA: ATP-binding protein [Saccharofermentans sp.]|nr:ATP-binding protein [Saccharofermentans sp.]
MAANNEIRKLTDEEHVLTKPDMYIGSINYVEAEGFLLNRESNLFEYKKYTYVPGLAKIINEVIDNSVDEAIKTDFAKANRIYVTIDKTSVKVEDNGRGVPVDIDRGTKLPKAVLAFTHAKAGSNFVEERKSIGSFGVGAFCTNVWSKEFSVETYSGKEKLILKCTDNLKKMSYKIKKATHKNSFTIVQFTPDLERFGLNEIDANHQNVIEQRLIQLAVSFPQIKFYFNTKRIDVRSGKSYLEYYGKDFEYVEADNFLLGVYPSDTDSYTTISYVNGLHMKNGGNHMDLICNEISYKIRNKLIKKYKTIVPADIYNRLKIVCVFRGFPNPKFDSQTKERLTNSTGEIRAFLAGLDFEKLNDKIYKNEKLMDPVVEIFKLREEYKKNKELEEFNKKLKKMKIKSDAYLAATDTPEAFFICEGMSAMGGLSAAFGRKHFAYYGSRGVPLNAYESTEKRIIDNKEMQEIFQICGLQIGKAEPEEWYEFEVDGEKIVARLEDEIEINGSWIGVKNLIKGDTP